MFSDCFSGVSPCGKTYKYKTICPSVFILVEDFCTVVSVIVTFGPLLNKGNNNNSYQVEVGIPTQRHASWIQLHNNHIASWHIGRATLEFYKIKSGGDSP